MDTPGTSRTKIALAVASVAISAALMLIVLFYAMRLAGGEPTKEVEASAAGEIPAGSERVTGGGVSNDQSLGSVGNLHDQMSIDELVSAAEAGGADALLELAGRYADGDGVAKSATESLRWYRRAVKAKSADRVSVFRLANMYARGIGTPKVEEEAIRWYRIGFENQKTVVVANMAMLMAEIGREEEIRGQTPDDWETFLFYQSFAEMGSSSAMCKMGDCYTEGRGVQHNEREAVQWYRRAAELGDQWAMCSLADRYANGVGTPPSDADAAYWYRNGALLGNCKAMLALAERIRLGVDGPKDDVEAYVWFAVAAASGMPYQVLNVDGKDVYIDPDNVRDATVRRDELAKQLSPESRTAAQAKAQILFEEIQAGN